MDKFSGYCCKSFYYANSEGHIGFQLKKEVFTIMPETNDRKPMQIDYCPFCGVLNIKNIIRCKEILLLHSLL